MRHVNANISPLSRATAALCTLLLALMISLLPLASVQAHAAEANSASAHAARLWPFDARVNVGFFIAVVDEGTESYPQSEDELLQILTGVYSPGIYIDNAFDASDFAAYGGSLYEQELYDLSGEAINERILVAPSTEQIADACARGGIDFDPETQTVIWYVVKSALSTWDTVWHIDGLLIPKAIAPEPDEPEPVDPETPTDPEPDDPSDPDPDPNPDEPDTPTDPEPNPDPEETDETDDGTASSDQNPSAQEKPVDTASEPPTQPPASPTPNIEFLPTASATPIASDSHSPASDLVDPAESETASPAPSSEVETPLQMRSDTPSVSSPESGAPQTILSGPVSTALHITGAVGLAGVVAGTVVLNIAAAQAGNALSSIDSQLRSRGKGRRR